MLPSMMVSTFHISVTVRSGTVHSGQMPVDSCFRCTNICSCSILEQPRTSSAICMQRRISCCVITLWWSGRFDRWIDLIHQLLALFVDVSRLTAWLARRGNQLKLNGLDRWVTPWRLQQDSQRASMPSMQEAEAERKL